MSEYKIVHKESLVGWFYVEAESPEEALQKYHDMANEGKIDFSDLEMVDSEDYVEDGSFTAFLYEDDGVTTKDLSMFDNKNVAIEFAMVHGWNEVVDDETGDIVYRKVGQNCAIFPDAKA